MTTKVKPRIYIGLLVFLAVIALLIFVAYPMQMAWGMWGLALTEIMLLLCAIVPALLFKWGLREIFIIRMPAIRQVFGVLVLWLGGYIAVLATSLITAYLFPEGMTNVSNDLLEFFKSVPFPVTLFILAVLPAVCEEALHRGLIQYTFMGANKWATVLGMGLIFGVFHLDLYRFLGTAVLGIILTLIMFETRNILLPMLFHFINNAMTSLSTLVSEPTQEVIQTPLSTVGAFLILSAAVPFILTAGSKLLKAKEESRSNPISKRAKYIAIAATVILAVVGVGIISASMNQEPLFETSFSCGINQNTPPHILEFSVEKCGRYGLELSIQGENVITSMVITNSSGNTIYDLTCGSMTLDEGRIDLEAGDYLVTFTHVYDGEDFQNVSVKIIIK